MGDYANEGFSQGYLNTSNLSITVYSPVQKEGYSDREYSSNESSGDVVSEFPSTPDTSVESTPEPSPLKDPQPSTSTGNNQIQSRGKDLSLLMKPGQLYQTPSESLYFREMVKRKTTPKQNPRKSKLQAKQDRENIPATLPRKGLALNIHRGSKRTSENLWLSHPRREMPTLCQQPMELRSLTAIILVRWHYVK